MIPNFCNDDDKHVFSDYNEPISISFIMSSVDEPKLFGEKDINTIYDYAMKCMNQKRFFEAHLAFMVVYKMLSVEFLDLTDEKKELYYETAYQLGYCLEELQMHESAIFYLQLASSLRLDTHIQEYINALCNNKDPRALKIIRQFKKAKVNGDPNSDAYKFHYAFLDRREAYVLIDQRKYDEAEAILKEMLNEPLSKEFAEGELKYIKQLRKKLNTNE
jgi:tetratricopeptide (TPR) repeat protein